MNELINNINKMEVAKLIDQFNSKTETELLEIYIASKIKILNNMINDRKLNDDLSINDFSNFYLDKIISIKIENNVIEYPKTFVNVEGINPKVISTGENGEVCVVQFLLDNNIVLFENAKLIKDVKPEIVICDNSSNEIDENVNIDDCLLSLPKVDKVKSEIDNNSFENSNSNFDKIDSIESFENNSEKNEIKDVKFDVFNFEDNLINKSFSNFLHHNPTSITLNEKHLRRSYLPFGESKNLLKIEGDLFLDFKVITSPDCETAPLKNSSKTASIVIAEDLGSISIVVDGENGSLDKIVKENKDLKRKVEMFALLSSKKIDKLKVSNLSSKNLNQLVTEIKKSQTKLINHLKRLNVKRLIILVPKDFNSKKKRKNFSIIDYYLATLFIDLNKKISKGSGSTKIKQLIGIDKNSKNNYSRFVDFKNSLFPNLFYYSEQKMSKKDGDKLGDMNQALNLFRFYDASLSYKNK